MLHFLFIEINDDYREIFNFPEKGKGKNVTLINNLSLLKFKLSALKINLIEHNLNHLLPIDF